MDELISRLSELRCQYNCFDENERDAYHTLSEAIKALSDVPDTNVGDMISRQAAIDAVHKPILDFFDICDDDEESPMTYKEEQLLELNKAITTQIKAVPSAQSDIIWCKDCKYFDSGTDEDGKLFFKCLGWVYGGTSEDDFCSHGERKDV